MNHTSVKRIVVHYVGYGLKTDVVHAVWQIGKN